MKVSIGKLRDIPIMESKNAHFCFCIPCRWVKSGRYINGTKKPETNKREDISKLKARKHNRWNRLTKGYITFSENHWRSNNLFSSN